jgi:t-SNARE complex subunit (syntaxin)
MSQPFTPPASSSAAAAVPNNMILAIVATVVSLACCLPHGVVSLIFAMQVNKKAAAGDIDGATKAARQAKMFAWISIIVGVVWFVVAMIFGLFGVIISWVNR